MADLYLSFAEADYGVAGALAPWFEQAGLSVWWDVQRYGGKGASAACDGELAGARVVLVLWSANSINSALVLSEAHAALGRGALVAGGLYGARAPADFQTLATESLMHSPTAFDQDGLVRALASIRFLVDRPPVVPTAQLNSMDSASSEDELDLDDVTVLQQPFRWDSPDSAFASGEFHSNDHPDMDSQVFKTIPDYLPDTYHPGGGSIEERFAHLQRMVLNMPIDLIGTPFGTRAYLIVEQSGGLPLRIPVGDEPVGIGRKAGNTVMLIDDKKVSRNHCRLRAEGEQVFIEDVGSANGTTVNNAYVLEPRALHGGEKIVVGDTPMLYMPV